MDANTIKKETMEKIDATLDSILIPFKTDSAIKIVSMHVTSTSGIDTPYPENVFTSNCSCTENQKMIPEEKIIDKITPPFFPKNLLAISIVVSFSLKAIKEKIDPNIHKEKLPSTIARRDVLNEYVFPK
jgi:hypothetical protein